MPFTHLHVHTEYSLLDGAARIKELVKKTKELGMDALAVTDHGTMYGCIEFYKACLSEGIKPIIGCEVYVAPRKLTDKENQDREPAHLVLLAENEEGYHNLCKLVSAGFVEGFYYKPRVDFDLLQKHSKGLICLSACLAGDVQRALLDGRPDTARAVAERLNGIFGQGNFYIELQDHGYEEQRRILPQQVKLAKELGIPLAATNDLHYVSREDAEAHDVLLCIQTQRAVDETDRLKFETNEFYLKSPAEMADLFKYAPEAIENTGRIAARCLVKFDFDKTHLPNYEAPEGYTNERYLRELCAAGLERRYKALDKPPRLDLKEIEERLDYELGVIGQMGYIDYFLIVWDFIHHAKESGIIVGPGRGSSAGSIVAYCLEITEIDPIRHNLVFERFLNPERISMPDIDIDFCYVRRSEVIDYVVKKYGADHVAQIVTFGTMAARAVIRDVGRALGMSYGEVDRIAKMIPWQLGMTIEKALEMNKELGELCGLDEKVGKLIRMALKLEGLPRHASTHAAGVVISKLPLTDHIPLNRNNDAITTQYPMGNIEELGLLKMDFLGLRTLTVIRDAADMVRQGGGNVDIGALEFDDPEVYRVISSGDTDGIFQMESSGMRAFMRDLRPSCFEDIYNGISLYRPGPMDSIPRFVEGKRNPASVHYEHPILESALSVTYGCMVYQEQVMQIVRDMAGYSWGRSDLVRRAMAKKKAGVMEKERQYFIYGLEENGKVVVPGAIRRGVPEDVAIRIFDQMTDFASYAFPKPHAVAYAVVAYWTAWLKVHHPVEFMAALMNSVLGNADKISVYIQYCRRKGIPVLPPDVNRSGVFFTVEGSSIRFGLSAIKNVGHAAMEDLLRERLRGPFTDFFDFAARAGETINKRMVESLIKAGAFDSTGASRAQLLCVCENTMDGMARVRKSNIAGQMSLFEGAESQVTLTHELPRVNEHPRRILLKMEKEMTGVYISGHPLAEYEEELSGFEYNSSHFASAESGDEEAASAAGGNGNGNGGHAENAGSLADGQRVEIAGIVVSRTQKATRNNDLMCFVTLEDLYGTVEVIVFPKVLQRHENLLGQDAVIAVTGRASFREEESGKLVADSVRALARQGSAGKLYVRLAPGTSEFARDVFMGVLKKHAGACPVYVKDEDKGKNYIVNRERWVRVSEELMKDLRDLVGEGCVKTG